MGIMGQCSTATFLLLAGLLLQVAHAYHRQDQDYLSHVPVQELAGEHEQQHGQQWGQDEYDHYAPHAYWANQHDQQHAVQQDHWSGHEQQARTLDQAGSMPLQDGSARSHAAGGGKVPVLTILAMTTFMSAMAGFGALPFFFCGKLKQSWAGLANAVACGVMLAASFDLLHEGAPYSPTLTILGMVLGAVFIKNSQEYLSQYEDASFEELSGADARKAMLIVGVMAAHAFGEGSGVGVSFSGNRGWAQGTLVTIAIGLHNIPEGMAVATVMVAKGAPPRKALFWSLFCAFPQALVAVPAYVFVETFQSLLPLAMGFAAGCMVWIVAAELLPDALENAPHPQVATAATLSAAWLMGLSMMISQLEQPNGHLASPLQAEPRTLLGLTACLLPALAAQPLVAGLTAAALPSMPVALGATSSIVLGLGAAGLVGQMLHGSLAIWRILLWAAMGAAGVELLWRNVLKPSPPSSHLDPKKSLESQAHTQQGGTALSSPKEADAYAQIKPDMTQWAAMNTHQQLHGPPSGELLIATASEQQAMGGAYMRGGHAGRSSNGGAAADSMAYAQSNGYYNGQYAAGMPPPSTAMLLNGGMQEQHTLPGQHVNGMVADGAWGHGSYAKHGKEAHGHGNGHVRVDHEPLDPHGFLQKGMHSWQHAEDADSTSGPLLGTATSSLAGQRSKHVRVAVLGVLVLMMHAGCGLGLHIAQAAATHAAETAWQGYSLGTLFAHWFLPLAIQGVPIGVACVGLAKMISGAGRWPALWTAAGCMLACISTVLGCLAGTTLGQPNADMSHYDAVHWTSSMQAATAGALLAFSGLYLWPAASSSKVQRAQAGGILGLAVMGISQLLLLGLCAGTPYCIRVTPPAAGLSA